DEERAEAEIVEVAMEGLQAACRPGHLGERPEGVDRIERRRASEIRLRKREDLVAVRKLKEVRRLHDVGQRIASVTALLQALGEGAQFSVALGLNVVAEAGLIEEMPSNALYLGRRKFRSQLS